ncbi:MAG TPA: protein phosphatase 2C domain-containing protein [Herpetosiphonaceae bacterium]
MSAWREMLARFRKDAPNRPNSTTAPSVAPVESTLDQPVVAVVEEPAVAVAEAEPEVTQAAPAIAAEPDETRRFGDTTRSLASAAPLLTVLQGERVLSAAALRDIGRERQENQDHCYAQILSFPSDHSALALGLFVVAAGMGGHHDGGYASKLALTTVVQSVLAEFVSPLLNGERRAPQPVMQAAVQAANAAVFAAGQEVGSDMGTTCTAVLLDGQQLITAHVGDSRALLFGGGVKQLTTDHTAVGRLIAIGALTPEEALDHPLRSHLYRSIGQTADVTVDVVTTTIHDESHLLLCSDGLWGLVGDAEIADIVTEAPTAHMAARHLIARANLLGGHDNISAVVVTLPAGSRG